MVTKAKIKPTIVDTSIGETLRPEAATVTPDDKAFTAYFESLLEGMPSWKRVLCAMCISMMTSLAVGYTGGYLAACLVIGALMLGAPIFIAQVIYVLGILVAIYAGYRAGAFTYIKVIDKTVDNMFSSAWDKVSGLFSSSTLKGATA